ncbi:MAG: 4-hydroxy-tetrahydrodipicolinate reductase [Bacillota bacterium]
MGKDVLISGACGKMGREVVKTVVEDTESTAVAAFDKQKVGTDIVSELGLEGPECLVYDDLSKAIEETNPEVIIDFTSPEIVVQNIKTGLSNGVHMIVGTTGITEVDMKKIKNWSQEYGKNALIVPNFALGAVLLMEFAARAGEYFNDVEIIELHHDQKLDAPSGTSLKTAEVINERKERKESSKKEDHIEKLSGVRGGNKDGINIHSVRLPGLVAHQEVIFGGEGQSLKIRHDSYDRKSFMPGVRLALDKIDSIRGVVYGLEKILD